MEKLEQKIGYAFKNKALLKEALTHSSYANENPKSSARCNERLEFLGDSILSIIVSEYLFLEHPDIFEGELTRLRAALVCEDSLFGFAKQIDLGGHILLGRGEESSGGRGRASVLSDAFEALIAAIYLDGGMDAARPFVLGFAAPGEKKLARGADYKTELQELAQRDPGAELQYRLAGESGPDHNKTFTVEVLLGERVIGSGSGRSKKQAEQEAAKAALTQLSR